MVRYKWHGGRGGMSVLDLSGGAPPPSSPSEQSRFMNTNVDQQIYYTDSARHWRHIYDPRNQFVIGRVELHDARKVDRKGDEFQSWRARSAQLEALYFEESAATDEAECDVDELAAALGERYGVPCEVGLPCYTQEDWDARTMLPGTISDERLGLYAPGGKSKYSIAVVPPRPEAPATPSKYSRAVATGGGSAEDWRRRRERERQRRQYREKVQRERDEARRAYENAKRERVERG